MFPRLWAPFLEKGESLCHSKKGIKWKEGAAVSLLLMPAREGRGRKKGAWLFLKGGENALSSATEKIREELVIPFATKKLRVKKKKKKKGGAKGELPFCDAVLRMRKEGKTVLSHHRSRDHKKTPVLVLPPASKKKGSLSPWCGESEDERLTPRKKEKGILFWS